MALEKRLFRDDADNERFVDRLSERVKQFNIRLYLFVCMTNHLHLVFETPEANCSRFMQSLSTAYSLDFKLQADRHLRKQVASIEKELAKCRQAKCES